jgi:hypothetical protein
MNLAGKKLVSPVGKKDRDYTGYRELAAISIVL